jgi:SAM-dependent methyltransferase
MAGGLIEEDRRLPQMFFNGHQSPQEKHVGDHDSDRLDGLRSGLLIVVHLRDLWLRRELGRKRKGSRQASQEVELRMTDDPFNGRHPTSHERMTGLPWNASYQDGPPPWDIGRPQPAIVRLAGEGAFSGSVLDAGCGTGENALHVASLGLRVLGVDVAETALAIAREKARERGIDAEFVAADAFHLDRLGRTFETVLDCGLFHSFDGEERPRYVASLASVTERGGRVYVLCFSDDGLDPGPHPITREELRAAFSGWNVAAIEPVRIQTRFHGENGAPGWLVTIQRI